jgi:hypothetical protein
MPGTKSLLEVVRPALRRSAASATVGPFLLVLEADDEAHVRNVLREEAVNAALELFKSLDAAANDKPDDPFRFQAHYRSTDGRLQIGGLFALGARAWYVDHVHSSHRDVITREGELTAGSVNLAHAVLPTAALKSLRRLALAAPDNSLEAIHARLENAHRALGELNLFAYAVANRILDDLTGQPLDDFAQKERWVNDLNALLRRIGAELVLLEGTDRVPAGSIVTLLAARPTAKYPEGRIIAGQTVGEQHSIRRGSLPRLMARPATTSVSAR